MYFSFFLFLSSRPFIHLFLCLQVWLAAAPPRPPPTWQAATCPMTASSAGRSAAWPTSPPAAPSAWRGQTALHGELRRLPAWWRAGCCWSSRKARLTGPAAHRGAAHTGGSSHRRAHLAPEPTCVLGCPAWRCLQGVWRHQGLPQLLLPQGRHGLVPPALCGTGGGHCGESGGGTRRCCSTVSLAPAGATAAAAALTLAVSLAAAATTAQPAGWRRGWQLRHRGRHRPGRRRPARRPPAQGPAAPRGRR